MIVEDFYTGEPVITGSPTNFSNNQDMVISNVNDEVEAANMASFARAKYDFDPGTRSPIVPINNTMYPGGYGYNMGIGAMPIGYSPYGNPIPTYGQYQNPALQPNYGGYGYYYQNPYMQQQQQPQNLTYHINGVGNSGEFLPTPDYQERIDKLQMEFWNKQQEMEAKMVVDRQSSVYGNNYGFGFNYYGTPYYNPYQYNSLNNELAQQVKDMENEARENRFAFNMLISKLAHNFAGQPIADSDLEERYRGKDVEIPKGIIPSIQQYQEQVRFSNLEPFDNSQQYRQFHAAVSKEFHDVVSPDGDLKETFANMGVIEAQWEMEEEMHRRKNAGGLYNSGDNSYKYFVRKKAQERYAREKGISVNPTGQNYSNTININQMRQSYANSLPTLKGATLAEDGTLSLPVPFGSHAGQTYSVHNSQEAEYDAKRERFGRFLDSIPGNIYLDQEKQKKMEKYNYG